MLGQNQFIIWLLSAGIAQGLFLAIVIYTLDVRNRTASRLLATLVALMTLLIAGEFLDALDIPADFSLGLSIELAVYPTIYLFSRALSAPGFYIARGHVWHFVPFVASLILLAVMQAIATPNGFSSSNTAVAPVVTSWTLAKIPYFIIYAYFADRALAQTLSAARRWRFQALRWVRIWFLTLYALISLVYVTFILFVLGLPFAPEPDFLGAVLIAATIFSVAYFIIANRKILDTHETAQQFDFDLASKATAYLETSTDFTDQEFSLSQLAAALDADETHLSKSLNARYNGGFFELLNQKRIAVFDDLLQDRENRERTILDLAFEAGFNSKATFYRAFKSSKGITPTAYRNQLTDFDKDSASHA